MAHTHLHKRLTDEQVRNILARYVSGELSAKQAYLYLDVSRARLYQILPAYKADPKNFSITYTRHPHKIDTDIEKNILQELRTEKEKIIDNPAVPTKRYNYSYIQTLLQEKHDQTVSLPTIIKRAREQGYWKPKPPKKIHDREVISNYIGELIQHDSSHHLFAPDGGVKWYLITSLDDHSRSLLYADLWLHESSWAHITAVEYVCLKYGIPHSYYADRHSIFKYVKDRDKHSPWHTYTKFTGDVDTQWQQVLKDCGIQPIYALSPQAKGKIERPYQWLQDHLVRTCVRQGIKSIEDARKVLQQEVNAYNWKRMHSTTGEIPMRRFEQAQKENKTLFRSFDLKPPFESAKDIFCLRIKRIVDPYRRISVQGFPIQVPNILPREEVELRLYPDLKTGLTEIRFWHKHKFVASQILKTQDIPIVYF